MPRTDAHADFEVEVGQHVSEVQLLLNELDRPAKPMCRVAVTMVDVPMHPAFLERTYHLRTATKECEPQGRLCIEARRSENTFHLRIIEHQELALTKDVYVEAGFEGRRDVERLKLSGRRPGSEASWCQLAIPQQAEPTPPVKVCVYQGSLLGGSVFLGELRLPVPVEVAELSPSWMALGPRLDSIVESDSEPSRGEMRIHLSLCCERVLPLTEYEALYEELIASLHQKPFDVSAVQLFEVLPQIDLTALARPMLNVFVHRKEIRLLLRKLYDIDISKCHTRDVNTLFRSKTMATTILCEYLRVYGHHYLQITVKPLIDQVYRERKRCEIDPARMESGESVEKNTANLNLYLEECHQMVVKSSERCPLALREVFSDLRDTIDQRFPGRLELQRLALTSFLVMRFFAAAILNPVAFGLRHDAPDARVARTLVLLSKLLQRLANSVVAEGGSKTKKLSPKEAWLQPVLVDFTDERHRHDMCSFLDSVALIVPPRQPRSASMPASAERTLSEGGDCKTFGSNLVFHKNQIANPLRQLIGRERRYVCLTESELIWQKDSNGPHDNRARLSLNDITAVEKTHPKSNIFGIRTRQRSVAFEATSETHRDQWIQAIEKARTLEIMARDRSIFDVSSVDLPRELERLRNMLKVHLPVIENWRQRLSGQPVPEGAPPLPAFADSEQKQTETSLLEAFRDTLDRIVDILNNLEKAHELCNQSSEQIYLAPQV